MVDGSERSTKGPRQRLRRRQPDEEGSDQARPLRDGDALDSSREGRPGSLEQELSGEHRSVELAHREGPSLGRHEGGR